MSASPSSRGLITDPGRSALMRKVGRQNTAAELLVRRHLHAAGLRFTLHDRRLPGTPDIVLPRRRSVVFVHGCFWHGHDCKHGRVRPRNNAAYWTAKLDDNRRRDRSRGRELRALGWSVEVVWECQARDLRALSKLTQRLRSR